MLLGIEVQSIEEKPYLIITLFFIPLKIIENNLNFIWWSQNLFIHLLHSNQINIYKMKNLLLKSFAIILFAFFIVLFVANVYTSIINIF